MLLTNYDTFSYFVCVLGWVNGVQMKILRCLAIAGMLSCWLYAQGSVFV